MDRTDALAFGIIMLAIAHAAHMWHHIRRGR